MPYSLRFHQQFHLANARPTVCLVCDIQYTDERFFYEHVMFAHESKYVLFCRYCDRTFDDPDELDQHDVVHKRFACAKCGQRFYNSQCLQSHKVIIANTLSSEYINMKSPFIYPRKHTPLATSVTIATKVISENRDSFSICCFAIFLRIPAICQAVACASKCLQIRNSPNSM